MEVVNEIIKIDSFSAHLIIFIRFFYALDRTKGNIFAALTFALYYLGVKLGFINMNYQIGEKVEHYRQPEPVVMLIPSYKPYSHSESQPAVIVMEIMKKAKTFNPDYLTGYSKSVISEIRAGGRLNDAVLLFITIWLLNQENAGGFQSQAPLPPHLESAKQLLFGGKSKHNPSSTQISMQKPSDMPQSEYNDLSRTQKKRFVKRILRNCE